MKDVEEKDEAKEQEMQTLLKGYLQNHLSRFREKSMSHEQFIGFCENRIYLYGGDTTFRLIAHFSDRLKGEIAKYVTE